ncbi:site-2 protease family protein [Megalodesulfovibrio paquesii]
MHDILSDVNRLLIFFLPFALGIICHEVAHGYVAWKLGDPTARLQGRLTLNPIKHVDPMGLAVFVLTALFTGFVFGWAKPVPVDPRYFKNPRQGLMLSSLAGPATNFALAVCFAFAFSALYGHALGTPSGGAGAYFLEPLVRICWAGISVNLVLGVLNLIPIPPLDGSKVVQYFLPRDIAFKYLGFERHGFILLLLLIAFGAVGRFIQAIVEPLFKGLLQLAGA